MTVSHQRNVHPIPDGYHTVTPWIISRDSAQLIDFLNVAFGAEEIARVVREDETIGRRSRQALQAGAPPVTKMTHLFWGDRVGRVRDPFGNLWWIQTGIEDVSLEEMERRAAENEWIDAMDYVQSAQFFPSASGKVR